uniref:Uncharacterized protein n=1 Tax=Avena sativa TaxID=4498 RepID=A0ACD5Y6I8_AVESA
MQMLLPLLATLLVLVSSCRRPAAASPAAACQRQCGGVNIPYPFGIGRGCYLDTAGDRAFEIACHHHGSGDVPRLVVDGFEVLGVDPRRGKMRVRSPVSSWCYDGASRSMGKQNTWSFNSTALRVSDADNKLAVVGCSALAYIGSQDGDVENRYVVGCHAQCASAASLPADGAPCNGTGCCLTPIPPGISVFDVGFDDRYNSSAVAGFSPCGYAVLVEEAAFEFRASYVTTGALMGDAAGMRLSAVLDWAVDNRTCRDAKRRKTATYACLSDNSECVDSTNGPGYLCNCSNGYQGNPYILGGCQDINECEVKGKYPCPIADTCINTMGGYKCPCPAHKRGTPDGTCEEYRSGTLWQVAIGVSIGVVMLALGTSCTYAIQEKRRLAVIRTRHFRQHGGQLLFEEMKKSANKQGISFTLFTRQELQEATGDFDERHVLGKGGNGTVYRGTLRDGTAVAIKRCRVAGEDERQQREFGRETLILSQINHKNIVKLYGCCLEVEVPMLVYQFIPNGTLYQLIHGAVVPFAARMRIAHETAEALAYLHSMASPPIIHGDVKSPNILLDEGYGAKVSDFGASSLAPAPADEAHLVTFVQGTCGYLDPEYMQTCRLTEKSDVYSFGVVLLELLTSRKALNLAAPDDEKSLAASFLSAARESRLDGLLDERIKSEVRAEALERVAKLAKMCLEMSGERRPCMREVAEELDRIRKMSSSQEDPCKLLGEGEAPHSIVDVNDRSTY